MRIPRTLQLSPESGLIHKFWQCHNKSFLLESFHIKDLYLKCTQTALEHKSVQSNIKISSFCLMSNHTHMCIEYDRSSNYLSQFMRIAHATFGSQYNKAHNKTGKVANERPKTPLIEDYDHAMRVHFYIEANPVRAGLIKLNKLQFSKYSSYGFYAFGKVTKWTKLLTIPDWYMELGKTAKERQSKYRKLFKEYLAEKIDSMFLFKPFIGHPMWVEKQKDFVKSRLDKKNSPKEHPPP